MKRGFTCLVLIMLLGCTPEATEISGESVDWVSDYHLGMTQASDKGKAAMLFFTADWCPPCVELKKYVFTDPKVVKASRPLVNISIDVDAYRQVMQDYKVRGIPAIFFFNPLNQKTEKFTGPRSVKNFVKHMKTAAENAQTIDPG